MNPDQVVALRQNHINHTFQQSAEVHAPVSPIGNPFEKNMFRVVRGTEVRVEVDENGKKTVESQDRLAHTEKVVVPFSNFLDNFAHRFTDLRGRDQVTYQRVLASIEPDVADMVQHMMRGVRDENGNIAKWEVDRDAIQNFLQSKNGLNFTAILIRREHALQAGGIAKYQLEQPTLQSYLKEMQYKLTNSREMWDFASNPQRAEYLWEIWGIDVNDIIRSQDNRNIPGRLSLRNRQIQVGPNLIHRTAGVAELKEALKQGYEAVELYDRDALGYRGARYATPYEGLIRFARSHGFMGGLETSDSEIIRRINRHFEDAGGIRDQAGQPLETSPGMRNRNFAEIGTQGNIRRMYRAEGAAMSELWGEFLREERIKHGEEEERKISAALEVKESVDLADPRQVQEKEQATRGKAVLEGQKIEIPGDLTANQQDYEQKVQDLREAATELAGKFRIRSIEPGMSGPDVTLRIEAAIKRRQDEINRRDLEMKASGAAPGTTIGPQAELDLVKSQKAQFIRDEIERRRGGVYSRDTDALIKESVEKLAESDFGGRIADLEQQVAAAGITELTAEIARLNELKTIFVEKSPQLNTAAEAIVRAVPKNMTEMHRSYETLVSGVTGAITEDELRTLSVPKLLSRIRRGPYGVPLDTPQSLKEWRERIIQAKTEQAARQADIEDPSPRRDVALFDSVVSRGRVPIGPMLPHLTADELITLHESEIERRLVADYGWDPSRRADNKDAIMRMRAVAVKQLIHRGPLYMEMKNQEIERQVAAAQRVIDAEPSQRAKERNMWKRQVMALRRHQDTMMEDAERVIDTIRMPGNTEYTNTMLIDPGDPTYSAAEKTLNAPRGYYKLLEYFGYNRNNTSMEARNTQLEEMQQILSPSEMAMQLFSHIPEFQAQVIVRGMPDDIVAVLEALHDAVQTGDIQPEQLRGAARAIIRELSEEANNIE